jgi:hypothetical protein
MYDSTGEGDDDNHPSPVFVTPQPSFFFLLFYIITKAL